MNNLGALQKMASVLRRAANVLAGPPFRSTSSEQDTIVPPGDMEVEMLRHADEAALSRAAEPAPREMAFPDPMFATGEGDVDRLRRVASEYFEAVRSMERQRDEWRGMFHQQAREHHAAQVQLQDHLLRMQRIARQVVVVLNKMRMEQKLQPFATIDELEQKLPDLAGDYERHMTDLVQRSEPLLAAQQLIKDQPSE